MMGGEAKRGKGKEGRRRLGAYSTKRKTSHIHNVLSFRSGFRSCSGSRNSARDGGAERRVAGVE